MWLGFPLTIVAAFKEQTFQEQQMETVLPFMYESFANHVWFFLHSHRSNRGNIDPTSPTSSRRNGIISFVRRA